MAHNLGLSPHDVNETLWQLQKQQIVTFKERKGPKGSVITHIRITDSALNGAPLNIIRNVVRTDDEVIGEAIDTALVARDIRRGATVQALTDLLRHHGNVMKVREASVLLGKDRLSTAIYSIAKNNPRLFRIERGSVRFLGPSIQPTGEVKTYHHTPCTNRDLAPEWCVEHDSLWMRGDMFCVREWERRDRPVDRPVTEAGADAQNDASTTPAEPIVDDLPAILVPPTLDRFPNIRALMAEWGSQAAARRAADILSDAGLDSLAITVLDAVRSLSPLEDEVLDLAAKLGWLDG
jgi:hypothetical protein